MSETANSPAATAAAAAVSTRHPRGLSTLFFTEMWERFSYYGMRAMLVLFMVDAVRGGMGLSDKMATSIYGLYTAAVYLMSLPGGWLGDRLFGSQRAVWYGGIIIALGHFTLAIPRHETFYLGLILVVIGSGILKPNMSALVGDLYPEGGSRRDAGFTIFYMGVNLGAFIGPLVCSLLGEKVNWHYGFGAAGIGMVLGLIQFRLTRGWLGEAGTRRGDERPLHPLERFGLIGAIAAVVLIVGLGMSGALKFNPVSIADAMKWVLIAIGGSYFLYLFFLAGLDGGEKKRVGVIVALFIASALFWMGFEQVGSSFNLFAQRNTVRTSGFDFANFNSNDFQDLPYMASRLVAHADPVSQHVWSRLANSTQQALQQYSQYVGGQQAEVERTLCRDLIKLVTGESLYDEERFAGVKLSLTTTDLLAEQRALKGQRKQLSDDEQVRLNRLLLEDAYPSGLSQNQTVPPSFVVPAGWFQSLGAIFIIIFAPVFAALWVWLARRNLDPSVPLKFAFALFLLALGFVVMAAAAKFVVSGNKVMPTWLTLTYLFHTFGELCLSPVGLSSVTKLAPRRLVGQLMGTWFLATSLGNLLAGLMAGDFSEDALSRWPMLYLRIALLPVIAGVLLIVLARPIKRWMAGIK